MAKEYKMVIDLSGGSSFGNGENSARAYLKNISGKIAQVYGATSVIRSVGENRINLIGVTTGNYRQQAQTQQIYSMATSGIVMLGVAFSNPYAAVATLAAKGLALGAEARQNQIQRDIERLEITRVRERGGPALNRSREGGEFF